MKGLRKNPAVLWTMVSTYALLMLGGILITLDPSSAQKASSPHWEIVAWGLLLVCGGIMTVTGVLTRNIDLEIAGIIPLCTAILVLAIAYLIEVALAFDLTKLGFVLYFCAFSSGSVSRLLYLVYRRRLRALAGLQK